MARHVGAYKKINGHGVPEHDWQKIKEDVIRLCVIGVIGGLVVASVGWMAKSAADALIQDRIETKSDVKMLIQASQSSERMLHAVGGRVNANTIVLYDHTKRDCPPGLVPEIYWTPERIAESMH